MGLYKTLLVGKTFSVVYDIDSIDVWTSKIAVIIIATERICCCIRNLFHLYISQPVCRLSQRMRQAIDYSATFLIRKLSFVRNHSAINAHKFCCLIYKKIKHSFTPSRCILYDGSIRTHSDLTAYQTKHKFLLKQNFGSK